MNANKIKIVKQIWTFLRSFDEDNFAGRKVLHLKNWFSDLKMV